MPTERTVSFQTKDANDGEKEKNEQKDSFECNICLETPKDPAVSFCGHLFCWPCINQWMNSSGTTCPVCKSSINKDKVILIYGQGSSKQYSRRPASPRLVIQRKEPEQLTQRQFVFLALLYGALRFIAWLAIP